MNTAEQLEQRALMILSDRKEHSAEVMKWAWKQVEHRTVPLGLHKPFTLAELARA